MIKRLMRPILMFLPGGTDGTGHARFENVVPLESFALERAASAGRQGRLDVARIPVRVNNDAKTTETLSSRRLGEVHDEGYF